MKCSCSPSVQLSWAFLLFYGSWQKILPHWIPSVQPPSWDNLCLGLLQILQIPFWMLLFSIRLWQPSPWCHWGGSSSAVVATLHFLTLVLLLAPQAWDKEKPKSKQSYQWTFIMLFALEEVLALGLCCFLCCHPAFHHSLTWEQLNSVNSKQVHVPKHFQMPKQVMLWNVF